MYADIEILYRKYVPNYPKKHKNHILVVRSDLIIPGILFSC